MSTIEERVARGAALDLEAIRRRLDWFRASEEQCRISPGQVSLHGYAAAAIECGRDVEALVTEIDRLRAELAEEKQAHEQTVENFGDWIDDHHARSFRIDPPTHTTGWVWNCLACPANGSFAREADAFGWASAHEMRTHGGGRGAAEAARAEL